MGICDFSYLTFLLPFSFVCTSYETLQKTSIHGQTGCFGASSINLHRPYFRPCESQSVYDVVLRLATRDVRQLPVFVFWGSHSKPCRVALPRKKYEISEVNVSFKLLNPNPGPILCTPAVAAADVAAGWRVERPAEMPLERND